MFFASSYWLYEEQTLEARGKANRASLVLLALFLCPLIPFLSPFLPFSFALVALLVPQQSFPCVCVHVHTCMCVHRSCLFPLKYSHLALFAKTEKEPSVLQTCADPKPLEHTSHASLYAPTAQFLPPPTVLSAHSTQSKYVLKSLKLLPLFQELRKGEEGGGTCAF